MSRLTQLEQALRKADAAGETEDAKILASEIRRLRGTSPEPSSLSQQFMRGAGIAARGAAPPLIGAALGAPAGPVGMAAGALALPVAEAFTQAANVMLPQNYQIPSPSNAVENLMTIAGLPVPETTAERAQQAAAGAIGGAGMQIGPAARLAETAASPAAREIAGLLSAAPGRQLAAAGPAAAGGQAVAEVTGSPLAGALTSGAIGAPFGLGVRQPPQGPAKGVLKDLATQAYEKAKQSGIAFNPDKFAQKMDSISQSMRNEGYTPTAYPKISSIFAEMKDISMPKDYTELSALRKMIAGAQKSADAEERRLASILKSEFDDYVYSAPASDISGIAAKTKEGAQAWKEARSYYAKESKAEIFDNMLENAKLDTSKFTQSGAENSLAQQLRQLSKNDKKMRLFSKEEQDAIKKAAKGGTTQNLLKFYGRFAPTGPVGGLFTGGATALEPTLGIPFTLGAIGARAGATGIRQRSVEDLAAMMRMGQVPQQMPNLAPLATSARGLLSPLYAPYTTDLRERQIGGL